VALLQEAAGGDIVVMAGSLIVVVIILLIIIIIIILIATHNPLNPRLLTCRGLASLMGDRGLNPRPRRRPNRAQVPDGHTLSRGGS
jgi:hypothetical protein